MFSAKNIINTFLLADPFPYVVIDDFMCPEILAMAGSEFESVDSSLWHRYSGIDERGKAAFNDMQRMPPHCRQVLSMFTHRSAALVCELISGIDGLEPDPTLYGGGLHQTESGGFLGIHIDNERHPNTSYVRRLNLILYCTEGWQHEWGGDLELWDRTRSRAVVRIPPLFNRAVLFETGNRSYHGHTTPLACPDGVLRKSIAAYYWSPPRPRARFFGSRDEMFDGEREAARVARSGG